MNGTSGVWPKHLATLSGETQRSAPGDQRWFQRPRRRRRACILSPLVQGALNIGQADMFDSGIERARGHVLDPVEVFVLGLEDESSPS
jgi:hypothetical protein